MKNKHILNLIKLIIVSTLTGCGSSSGESSSFRIKPPVVAGDNIYIVEENTREAFHIQATDNGSLKYYLSGRDAKLLYVNIITGAVFFNEPTDYEKKTIYNITIIIEDSVGNRTTKDIIIKVKDNPNETVIVPTEHNSSLPKNNEYFITMWQTNQPGVSANTQITIPTLGDGYNYSVDWGDGKSSKNLTVDATHTYSHMGIYKVKIIGKFPRIVFDKANTDRKKILSIVQWGNNVWSSMGGAFATCSNMVMYSQDTPNLSKVTDMNNMFAHTSKFNQDISSWDVSHVTNMRWMFNHAKAFNQDISSWNTSNVTSTQGMFNHASAFNQDIGSWDVSHITNMDYMFTRAKVFNQDLSRWNVSNVRGMKYMFEGAANLTNQNLSSWNVRKVNDHEGFLSNTGSNNVSPVFDKYDIQATDTGITIHDTTIPSSPKLLTTYNIITYEQTGMRMQNIKILDDKQNVLLYAAGNKNLEYYVINLSNINKPIKKDSFYIDAGYRNAYGQASFIKLENNIYLMNTSTQAIIYNFNTYKKQVVTSSYPSSYYVSKDKNKILRYTNDSDNPPSSLGLYIIDISNRTTPLPINTTPYLIDKVTFLDNYKKVELTETNGSKRIIELL